MFMVRGASSMTLTWLAYGREAAIVRALTKESIKSCVLYEHVSTQYFVTTWTSVPRIKITKKQQQQETIMKKKKRKKQLYLQFTAHVKILSCWDVIEQADNNRSKLPLFPCFQICPST